jgi:hypothetical protein
VHSPAAPFHSCPYTHPYIERYALRVGTVCAKYQDSAVISATFPHGCKTRPIPSPWSSHFVLRLVDPRALTLVGCGTGYIRRGCRDKTNRIRLGFYPQSLLAYGVQ